MYTKGQAVAFIEKCFGSGTPSNQGANHSVVCPICATAAGGNYTKRKLAIRTDNFVNRCWICGHKARNLLSLIRKYRAGYLAEYLAVFVGADQLKCADEKEQTPETQDKLVLPSGFVLLAADMSHQADMYFSYRAALGYLAKRFDVDKEELSPNDMWYWKFGISLNDPRYANRVIMPSFDSSGELNYYTCRSTINAKPKYINPPIHREEVIFNEMNIDWKEPLTIVEGPFDLIKCNQNATCLLGSELTTDYKLFLYLIKNKTPVILALDPDARDKTLGIANFLSEYDIPVSIVNIPQPFTDVGELSKTQFISLLDNAILFTKDYLLRAKISNILKA